MGQVLSLTSPPATSLWNDPADPVVASVLSHYQQGVRRRDLAAVRQLRRILAPVGAPHYVVVVGTNGKSSTATYIARLLSAVGVRTGLYTSPHISHWTERLLIDGVPCDEHELLSTLRSYDTVAQSQPEPLRRSLRFFDILSLVAEEIFGRHRVEVAVFESGIGGRLDATRALAPQVVALSSVGYDHQELLGDTLPEILVEKLGVAPPDATVVSAPLTAELRQVERDWAAAHSVTLVETEAEPVRHPAALIETDAEPARPPLVETDAEPARPPLVETDAEPHDSPPAVSLPRFQRQNLAVALRTCQEAARRFSLAIDPEALVGASRAMDTGVTGRFHRGVLRGTRFLADTGHNVTAWQELRENLDAETERYVAVLALTTEREPRELAETFAATPAIDAVVVTTTRVRRGHPPDALADAFAGYPAPVTAAARPELAFELGLQLAEQRGVSLLITGSTYLVADFLAWLRVP
jgi:dihydrofolate synthase/folylpolyglutamate synthase